MKKGPEHIDLKLKTIITKHQYNIDDMIAMFGDRIKKAVYYEEHNDRWSLKTKLQTTNKCAKGLIMKKMSSICKKSKNKDIEEAYRYYIGILIAPYTIQTASPVIDIIYSADIDFSKYQGDQMIQEDDRVIKANVL